MWKTSSLPYHCSKGGYQRTFTKGITMYSTVVVVWHFTTRPHCSWSAIQNRVGCLPTRVRRCLVLHLATGRKNQERIGSEEDDLITGICDNPDDPSSFYVVGATKGDVDGIQDDQLASNEGSLQPFIRKVEFNTLRAIWTVQWGSIKNGATDQPTEAFALDCTVVGDTVYVAGNIMDGASMVQGFGFQDNKGGDDIWVAKITDFGSSFDVNWVHQMGTAGDDHLARYGGITADRNGGIIVYGDTTGGLFRDRGGGEAGITDIFVMRLDEDDFIAPVAPPTEDVSPVEPPVDDPTVAPVAAPTEPPHEFVAIGAAVLTSIQTGPSQGSSYASSIMSDGSGIYYLVGSTYDPDFDSDSAGNAFLTESSCFLYSWEPFDGPVWADKSVLGNDNFLDSCHGVGLINPQALALIGNSEPGGLFADPANKMSGFASVVNKESLDLNGGTIIQMSNDAKIPYPISVVTDSTSGVYVIALTTVDDDNSELYNLATQDQFPNWIKYEKYGSAFDMTVMKFNYQQLVSSLGIVVGDATLTEAWHQEFPFNPEVNGRVPRVYLSGLILKNDSFLIVAGSTFGKGPGYGLAVNQDEDGFVTLLNLQTGELFDDHGNNNQERIGSAADDLVTGICDNPNDPDSFYLVGATDGNVGGVQDDQMTIQPGSRQAFIKKMDLNNLDTTWTIQWGAIKGTENTHTYALSCTVAEDGVVYVGGQVEDGAGMVQGFSVQESKGGDDIWVAKVTDLGSSYNVNWLQQVGTDGADHLARYGGITYDIDTFNPIIYGDTTGSLGRTRDADEETTDIFVMTLDSNFEMPDNVGTPAVSPAPSKNEPSVQPSVSLAADDDTQQPEDSGVGPGRLEFESINFVAVVLSCCLIIW